MPLGPAKVVDLAAERCPPADQIAVAEGKTLTPRPKPDGKTPDGAPAMKTPTVMAWVDRLELSETAKGKAIARLAENHESCRKGATTANPGNSS